MANPNSPESPPSQEQIPQRLRIGIEIPLDPFMPKPELTPSSVVPDGNNDNLLGLYYRVDVEALSGGHCYSIFQGKYRIRSQGAKNYRPIWAAPHYNVCLELRNKSPDFLDYD